MSWFLAGEVGPTHTRLALFESQAEGALACQEHRFENVAFSGLVAMVGEFMHGVRVDAAAFATPHQSPQAQGHSASEQGLHIHEPELRHVLGTEACGLLHEAQAAAMGLLTCSPERQLVLQPGQPNASAPSLVVHLAHGYGRAIAFAGSPALPLATASGHGGFAPRNAIERRLLSRLAEHLGYVSLTDVFGERALRQLYKFLIAEGLAPPTALAEIERAPDPEAEIARLGLRDLDRACAAAVAFYADLLGADLCNVALSHLPYGGIFITGEKVRRLRPALEQQDVLLDAFLDREDVRPVLQRVPLTLVDAPDLVIQGAKLAAQSLLK